METCAVLEVAVNGVFVTIGDDEEGRQPFENRAVHSAWDAIEEWAINNHNLAFIDGLRLIGKLRGIRKWVAVWESNAGSVITLLL